jgi:hypothetical protein
MARQRKSVEKAKRTALPKTPFPMGNRGDFIRKAWIAVEDAKGVYKVLTWNLAYNVVEVILLTADKIDYHHNGKKQYYVDGDHCTLGPNGLAKTHTLWLKSQALRCGATPDAIRLMKKVIDLTKKEEDVMARAEKLRKKTAKTATDADAGAVPVGKGGKVAAGKKGKGNADALKKARETRAANAGAPDVRKIKILNKENPYRAESGRASSFDALKGAKTVEDYKAAGGKVKYLSRWEAENRISLS